MRYTVPIVAEKTIELLDVEPLYAHYSDDAAINGFSTYTRERRRSDILWVNDNSGGQRPYATCAARHCIHIASRQEEAEELCECEADRSLVVLPHTVQLRRLVTAMERCFAYFNAWNDELFDALRRGGDWEELLEIGHRVLQNPMIIYNRSMRVLAYTNEDGTNDPIWSETVRAGTALVDTALQSDELMRFLERVERHDTPFRHRGEGMSSPFWCAPVQVDGRRRGMVNVVEYRDDLGPGKLDLLKAFADGVSIAMRRADYGAPIPDAVPRQFIIDLLNGEIATRDRLNTRLIAVDWRVQEYFCSVIFKSSLPFLTGEQWRGLYNRLALLGLNSLSCILGEEEPRIALLLTAPGPERFARPLEVVEQFCAVSRLRAGISDVYSNLMETPRFYRQSEVALELESGAICRYDQARNARMLRHLKNHPFREDLMHPAVIRLAELDRAEGAEYIPTLRALYDHGFNQLETAEALNIHRTTLAYRLRRIQELTGLKLTGAEQTFHVAVSLKLMEGEG